MSGHYATLLRSTVVSLPDCEVYADWHNARDIPVSAGTFDVKLYPLSGRLHAPSGPGHPCDCRVSQPPALAATAYLAEEDPSAQPNSLTLIGGPIDPKPPPGSDRFRPRAMGQLENHVLHGSALNMQAQGAWCIRGCNSLLHSWP